MKNSAEILEMSVQLAFEESKIKRRLIETDIRWKREEICEAGIELSIKRDLFNNKILRKHICKFFNSRVSSDGPRTVNSFKTVGPFVSIYRMS